MVTLLSMRLVPDSARGWPCCYGASKRRMQICTRSRCSTARCGAFLSRLTVLGRRAPSSWRILFGLWSGPGKVGERDQQMQLLPECAQRSVSAGVQFRRLMDEHLSLHCRGLQHCKCICFCAPVCVPQAC